MAPPKIKLKFFEHPSNPLPPDGSVHEVRTADGYGLRLGLWPVPGLEIRVVPPPQPAKQAAAPVDSARDGSLDHAEPPEAGASQAGAEGGEKSETFEMPTQSGAAAPDDREDRPGTDPKLPEAGAGAPTPADAVMDSNAPDPDAPTPDSQDPDARDTDNPDAAVEPPGDALDLAGSKGSANPDESKSGMEPEPEAAESGAAPGKPESEPGRPDPKLSNGAPGDAESPAPEAVDEAVAPPAETRALSAAPADPVVFAVPSQGDAETVDAAGTDGAPETGSMTENADDVAQANPQADSVAEANPVQDESGGGPARDPDPEPDEVYPQVESSGTVILLNGRTEFIEKYAEVIGELIARGFCVAALDWRGQGGSERLIKGNPRKGHVDHIDSYVEDLIALLDFLETTNCPKPYFCLAHSTGGQVLLRAAPVVSDRIRRAVTTAPFLDLANYRLPKGLIYGLVATLTYMGLGELYVPGTGRKTLHNAAFEGNILTGDRRRYELTQALEEAFEEVVIGGPTLSWVYAALKSAEEIREPDFLARINLPMLMLSASEDRLVSSRAIANFADMVRTITHIGIPGARHEILMERDEIRGQFWAAFDAFIPGDS